MENCFGNIDRVKRELQKKAGNEKKDDLSRTTSQNTNASEVEEIDLK